MKFLRAALLVIAVSPLSACSSSPATAPAADPMTSAVSQLSSEDKAAGHSHSDAEYSATLKELTKKCTQTDPRDIVKMADAVWDGLQKAGVTDEGDRLALLQHLSGSIPAGAPQMDCVQQFAAYQTLRVEG